MNPTIQPGMHPDADSLTAFAEQLLPVQEREQILAHMASCGRCREVVFLARQATDEERATVPTHRPQASWFGGWRWAWVPVGALALFIGFAAVLHFRHAETPREMAGNLPGTEALQKAAPSQASTKSQPATREANMLQTAPSASKRTNAPISEEKDKGKFADDEKRDLRQKESALGAAASPIVLPPPGLSGGSVHGQMAARAKASPFGGPMADNLMQQQNANQQQFPVQQQSGLAPTQNFDQAAANKRKVAAPVTGVSAEVTAEAPTNAASVAPALAPQLSEAPATGRNFARSSLAVEQLKKAPKVTLPNRAEALSVASAEKRIVAIDTSGALFLSEDNGRHWQPVPTQWTGRALLVRTLQPSLQIATLQAVPAVRFELVNDKLQTWISDDGKTWTAQNPPGK